MTIPHSERTLDFVIDQYLTSRRQAVSPLSTHQALTALRSVLPRETLTDRELVDRFAAAAILRGFDLFFDSALAAPAAAERNLGH